MSWKPVDWSPWGYCLFWMGFLLVAMFGAYWVIYAAVKAALKA